MEIETVIEAPPLRGEDTPNEAEAAWSRWTGCKAI